MYALLIVVMTATGIDTIHVTTTRSLVSCEVQGMQIVDTDPTALNYVCTEYPSN